MATTSQGYRYVCTARLAAESSPNCQPRSDVLQPSREVDVTAYVVDRQPVPAGKGGVEEDYFVEAFRADATCPEAVDSSAADFTTDDAAFTTQRASSRASGPKTPTEPATLPV